MQKLNGKKFEKLIQDSCHLHQVDCVRLKDAGWQGEKTQRRFTVKNICDFILFDGYTLFKVEAKHRKSALRFDDVTQEKALKREFNKVVGYYCSSKIDECLLIYFENKAQCWKLHISMLDELRGLGKKSFNSDDCEKLSEEHPLFCEPVELYVPKGKRKHYLNMGNL